jgi:hypothetical protein
MASIELRTPKNKPAYYKITANITLNGRTIRKFSRFEFDPKTLKTAKQRVVAATAAAFEFEAKAHLIRLLKEQKPLKFFTVDKDRMHDFARAAKAHGLLFCPIRDKMDPDHIEIAILQDDASKANRIIEKLQLDVVDTGAAELVDAVQQNLENAAPNHEDTPTVDFPLGSENASPSEPFSDSSKSFANSPSPRADLLRAKGERPSIRMELQDITAYLRNRAEAPKDRMPKLPVKIRRKEKVL